MVRAGPGQRTQRGISAASIALAAALGLGPLGCGVVNAIGPSTCDRSEKANPPVLYTEGEVKDGIYMSSAWDGELLYFPGGMHYLIEHKLGETPQSWHFYLSFSQYGTTKNSDGSETGFISEASGNQVELRCIDDKYMKIANGSCVEYWLLAVASAGEGSDVADAGSGLDDSDAGADGGAPSSCGATQPEEN